MSASASVSVKVNVNVKSELAKDKKRYAAFMRKYKISSFETFRRRVNRMEQVLEELQDLRDNIKEYERYLKKSKRKFWF